MSNDAELLKKDAESSKPVTANVDGCEDQEISDVAIAEEQKHEAENERITAPVPERVAENGSNIAEEQKHEAENEKITAPVPERVAENGSNIAEEQKHEAENEKMMAPVPERVAENGSNISELYRKNEGEKHRVNAKRAVIRSLFSIFWPIVVCLDARSCTYHVKEYSSRLPLSSEYND
ncbi:hypothetical protein ACFE04_009021 [Oxalis oulophora]